MTRTAAPAAPGRQAALYAAVVAAVPAAELKGASMPYTSINGNMYSFLDKSGVAAIRLSEEDRVAFAGETYVHESGALMTEYVALPAVLLEETGAAAALLKKSLAYARTLKPKATTRKKSAA